MILQLSTLIKVTPYAWGNTSSYEYGTDGAEEASTEQILRVIDEMQKESRALSVEISALHAAAHAISDEPPFKAEIQRLNTLYEDLCSRRLACLRQIITLQTILRRREVAIATNLSIKSNKKVLSCSNELSLAQAKLRQHGLTEVERKQLLIRIELLEEYLELEKEVEKTREKFAHAICRQNNDIDLAALLDSFNGELHELALDETQPFNVLCIGEVSSGKSSLFNSVTGATDGDNYAPTGQMETTMKLKRYAVPNHPGLILWDSRGFGAASSHTPLTATTDKVDAAARFFEEQFKQYNHEQMASAEPTIVGFDNMHAVIICTKGRFNLNDIACMLLAQRNNVPFFFVRTCLDDYLNSVKRDTRPPAVFSVKNAVADLKKSLCDGIREAMKELNPYAYVHSLERRVNLCCTIESYRDPSWSEAEYLADFRRNVFEMCADNDFNTQNRMIYDDLFLFKQSLVTTMRAHAFQLHSQLMQADAKIPTLKQENDAMRESGTDIAKKRRRKDYIHDLLFPISTAKGIAELADAGWDHQKLSEHVQTLLNCYLGAKQRQIQVLGQSRQISIANRPMNVHFANIEEQVCTGRFFGDADSDNFPLLSASQSDGREEQEVGPMSFAETAQAYHDALVNQLLKRYEMARLEKVLYLFPITSFFGHGQTSERVKDMLHSACDDVLLLEHMVVNFQLERAINAENADNGV